jgi:transposase, IS5 family
MDQLTLATGTFEPYRKQTRREKFLAEMDRAVPWKELCAAIEPVYPKAGNGRPPIGLERMVRMYFLQHWFNLSDPGAEEALYDSRAMREFVGIDLGKEPVPDETTICKFRHLLEKHRLGNKLFKEVSKFLQVNGFKIANGTIVDATIIHSPTSTKNKDQARDEDAHQTKKGGQWYFGMKLHIGVDSKTKLVHTIAVTAANVHDSQMLPELLHGDETRVWGDSAYAGQRSAMKAVAPNARDFTQKKGARYRALTEDERASNRIKSRVRAKVEHVFGVIKRVFGYTRTRYRGLEKNAHAMFVTSALANIFMVRRQLLRA